MYVYTQKKNVHQSIYMVIYLEGNGNEKDTKGFFHILFCIPLYCLSISYVSFKHKKSAG